MSVDVFMSVKMSSQSLECFSFQRSAIDICQSLDVCKPLYQLSLSKSLSQAVTCFLLSVYLFCRSSVGPYSMLVSVSVYLLH